MTDVVLLYARDCPNVREARTNLLAAFARESAAAEWREVDLAADDTPPEWRQLGSPSVLVDGHDVAPGAAGDGSMCRLYDGSRAPSVEAIADAMRQSAGRHHADEPRSSRGASP